MEEFETPFLILNGIKYRFVNENSKNVIQRVYDKLISEGISQDKVETTIANIIDAVHNDF